MDGWTNRDSQLAKPDRRIYRYTEGQREADRERDRDIDRQTDRLMDELLDGRD